MKKEISDYLSQIGKKGGQANTKAQNAARRRNGKKGGRPKESIDKPEPLK